MNIHHLPTLLAGAVLVARSAVAADVGVVLSPADQVVSEGSAPRFAIAVQATGKPVLVLKFDQRADLRDNYARLVVTHDGVPVQVPRAISDPGPTNPSDYVRLRRGEVMRFEHVGTPLVLSMLPPGDYKAALKFQRDWRVDAVVSNSVSFKVVAK